MVIVQVRQADIIVGTVGGTLAAAVVAWLWAKYGDRINLARFFQVTAIFLAVFVVQLAIYGVHELSEANIFAGAERLHWATEEYGPEGFYGHLLSYALLVLPMAWLAISALLPQKHRAAA
jgi:high-affinity iron transporter